VLSRRDCLIWGASGIAAAGLAGCAPVARRFESSGQDLPLPKGDIQPTVRLLNRAGFGPRPGDIARVEAQGHDAYFAAQCKGDAAEDIGLNMQLSRLDVLQLDDPDTEDLPQAEVIRQLQQAALLRAVHGKNQLLERMVDFWSNHFNVYARKGDSAFRLGTDQREVVRANALGKFPDLLQASTHSAAMLAFLDNPQNFKAHPNENYARELMELHTLGIGGGYTQRDVQEVARCFTGWGIETRAPLTQIAHGEKPRARGKLRFDPDLHDDGPKLVLGHVIPAHGGENDAKLVLEILAAHPSTANFIAKKLVRQFHGGENQKLQDQVAAEYQSTGGDITSMLKPLFNPYTLAEAPPVMKRPFELIASAVRAVGGYTDGGSKLQDHLATMGEPLYQWPMPDGYPVKTSAWTGNMLPRWNFAYEFAAGHITGTNFDTTVDPFVATQGRDPDGERLAQLMKDSNGLALGLCSPDFQWC
jgi:uncharacterized protein (DUF1800 family)